jgi:asparagine synthase (glutamine-hydrolysing)
MCGIFGYFDRERRSLGECQIREMGYALRHRGPDDFGFTTFPGAAVGNTRLSIIDIAGGHQPFVSDDGDIVVVQNGEIFNYIELAAELAGGPHACRTKSDTEVLLRLYERDRSLDFLSKLNGMFAIAIYDRTLDTLFLARDRIGVKPLFYHYDGRRLAFASEIKALLPSLDTPAAVNADAVHHYLTYNYVPPPHTMHSGVWHLMPGHHLRISRRSMDVERWWDLARVAPDNARSEASWIEEFNATLDDAVALRMRSDVPVGAFLSGGVDSSTVVGLMQRHAANAVQTFCIGFEDPRYDESAYAQEASDRFGTQHTMRRVDPDMLDLWPMAIHYCDQPHGDISFLPTYRVSELAAEHVKVVLTGDGGDELFAGYDKYANFFAEYVGSDTADFRTRYLESISLFQTADKLALYSKRFRGEMADTNSLSIADRWFEEAGHHDLINQALYLDTQLLLSGNNLVKPDRMGMAVSIEARTPFLDYRMVELAFRIPGRLKLKDGITKYLYKKAVEPLIGHQLAYRKKQMFTVPVGDWFRSRLQDYARARTNSLLAKCDFFDQSAVRSLVENHIAGAANNTREIRALIALDLWLP